MALDALRANWQQGWPRLTGSVLLTGSLTGSVVLSALVLGTKQVRDEQRNVSWRDRFFSHPLVAWVIENTCCVGMTAISILLVPRPKQGCLLSGALTTAANGILTETTSTALWHFCTNSLYKHADMFSEKGRPGLSVWGMLKGWMSCNMWIQSFNAIVIGSQIAALTPHEYLIAQGKQDFSLATFLFKFGILRVIVDAGFWFVHRALHHPVLYSKLHRKHHEHARPSLATNFHSDPIDFYIEAFVPLIVGLISLERLGLKPARFELALMLNYQAWHAMGSHCGKPLPVMTWFPPLAPLYQLVVGTEHGARHHDVHHARLNCNYGSAVWTDILMGTRLTHHRG